MVLVPVGVKRVGIHRFADLAVNVAGQSWIFLPRNAALPPGLTSGSFEHLWQVLREDQFRAGCILDLF